MVSLFEHSLADGGETGREDALSLTALCIGGMVVARALPGNAIAEDIRQAALNQANAL